MDFFDKTRKALEEKYKLDIIEDIVLVRENRAIYYMEYKENNLELNKVYGASKLDKLSKDGILSFNKLDDYFDIDNYYGEVAGYDYYKKVNLDAISNLEKECNVTFPLRIDGERVWLRFNVIGIRFNENDEAILAACFVTDVTKYLIHEEALYEKTHKDELTTLFNRYTLNYHFELHSHMQPLAAIYFDVDDFKQYNDTYGHHMGDKVLVKLANNLIGFSNDKAKCYRLSGDEFFCLVKRESKEYVIELVELIQATTRSMFIDNKQINVTLSVGISYLDDPDGVVEFYHEDFIKHANTLMFESKAKGKDQYTIRDYKKEDE